MPNRSDIDNPQTWSTFKAFILALWDQSAAAKGYQDAAGASAAAAASSAATTQTLGNSFSAAYGATGYQTPVAYASGLSMILPSQTVSYAGVVYAPILSMVPFTTSGTFEVANFRVIQGVVAGDLQTGTGITGLKIGTAAQAGTISVNYTRTTINNHAFEDWGTLALSAGSGLGYCSFDAKATMVNTGPEDHLVSFQARQTYSGSGTLASRMNGMDVAMTHNGTGTIASSAGITIANPSGAGPITNCYGLTISAINRGSALNYGIYNLAGINYHAGKTSFGTTTSPVYKLDVGGTDSDGIRYVGATGEIVMGSETYGGYVGTKNNKDLSLVRNNSVIVVVKSTGITLNGGLALKSSTTSSITLQQSDGTGGFLMGRSIGANNNQDFFIFDQVAGVVNYQYSAALGNQFGGTKFGVNSATPQAKAVVSAASTDLASAVALVNQLRAALVANGICI